MPEVVKRLFKRSWGCNVIGCSNEVEYSGGICASCESDAGDFRLEQERLDRQFQRFGTSEYQAVLLNVNIGKVESYDKYVGEELKMMLHRRDEAIAGVVNKIWSRKLRYENLH